MKFQYIVGAVCLCFLLFNCTTDQTVKSVEYTCASATAVLKTVTALNLSAADAAKVRHAVTVLDPVCSMDQPPTLSASARAGLEGALAELKSVGK